MDDVHPPETPKNPASSGGPQDAIGHVPVLVPQVLALMLPKVGESCLDCTVGRGGHAAIIAPLLREGRYIGLDVDPENVAFSRQRLVTHRNVTVIKANFATARATLDSVGISRVNLVLADLGFASNQMSDPARGLSFSNDGPLDMRLDPELSTTAADLVNHLPERELADLIYRYGQERQSRRIARKIVEERQRGPILTSGQLAQVIRRAPGMRAGPNKPAGRFGRNKQRIDPATRSFMALRIAVNDELGALERLLAELPGLLAPGGRAGIISFHSLEDGLVKRSFAQWRRERRATLLTRKPIVADADQQRDNPRSRSAKLRVLEWIG